MPFELVTTGRPHLTTINDPEPILRLSRAMSRVQHPLTIEIPLTSGEIFHGDGRLTRIPRGEVDAAFVPGRGTVNRTMIEPPVPATVPMRTVRVPKGVGAVVVVDWGVFCAEQIGTRLAPMVDAYSDYITRMTAKQDLELAEQTALMTQVNMQAAASRLRSKVMTRRKTAQGAGRKTTRIRGYSRR